MMNLSKNALSRKIIAVAVVVSMETDTIPRTYVSKQVQGQAHASGLAYVNGFERDWNGGKDVSELFDTAVVQAFKDYSADLG